MRAELFVVYGETGAGRLVTVVGEIVDGKSFRAYGIRDITPAEARSYRRTG